MKLKRLGITFLILILILSCLVAYSNPVRANAMPFYGLNPQNLVLRGEFSTDYSTSSEERKHNIELAIKSLNNIFIDVKGELSFNKKVGERTERRGYKTAKIIKEGKFIEGVGGGVCQVSTTLYNAALLSGLKILEYHPHSLAVSYVEPSFDAMVSYGHADLRILNNTDNPVIIYAKADGEKITVSFYGEPKDYQVERKSVVVGEVLQGEDNIVYDEYGELDEGESKILSYGKNGIKSEGYLVIKRKGKIVSNKRIRKDTYSAINRTVLMGKEK